MPTRVVACVIEREGRLLLCRRPGHKRHGGLWEFPGGKIEPGEDHRAAAARELREELAVRVTGVGPVRLALSDPGSDFVIEFVSTRIEGEPAALEHEVVSWLAPEDALRLKLAPSDRRFLEQQLAGG